MPRPTLRSTLPSRSRPRSPSRRLPRPRSPRRPPAPRARRRRPAPSSCTLTVTGTAEGEWQADLVHGTQRVVSGLVIPAIAVAKAAKELHEDIAEGIESVLEAARDQHRTRMEELEAELARVKAQLAELSE
ncbi:DUF6319 family protein [Lentzea chajnantorensis]